MLDNPLFQLIIQQIQIGMNAILGANFSQITAENSTPITTEAGFGILADSVSINVVQSYQPTFQGTPTQPTLFIYKIGDQRVGFPEKKSKWIVQNQDIGTETENPITTESGALIQADGSGQGVMQHWEVQRYLTTFQISALATQDPSTPMQLTASDLVNYAVSVMQSDTFIAAIEAQGVGVLRISDVRNPYFIDDRGQFEASPSFDAVLAHNQVIVSQTPIITSEIFRIYPV